MIKKYVRKDPPVEATQWLGNNWEEIKEWVQSHNETKYHPLYRWNESSSESVILVRGEDGETGCSIGDWIVRSNFGEYCVYKNYQFKREFAPQEEEITLTLEDRL